MADLQTIILILVITGAAAFLGAAVYRNVLSFTRKKTCDEGCGCGRDAGSGIVKP